MPSRLSLKDQLAELDQPAPIDLDPEDVLAGADSLGHRLSINHPSATEHYIDVAPSSLRNLHENVSDPKYDAVRTSRKNLYQGGDDGSEEEKEDVDDEEEPSEEQQLSESESEDEVPTSPAQDKINEASRVSTIDIPSLANPPQALDGLHTQGDIASSLRLTHEADKKKGTAVSRQINLWDTLLDARIQLQKAVTAANRLPLPGASARYAAHPSAHEALDSLIDVAGSLIEDLFTVQEDLLGFNEMIETPPRKRRKLGTASEHVGDHSGMIRELSESASVLERSYHPWVIDTLSKWSSKVQAVAPNVLLPTDRGSFMRDGRGSQMGVVAVIDEVLRSDGAKLLDRTRRQRDAQKRIGEAGRTREEGDGEGAGSDGGVDGDVFDDSEFYQQLLRDVIAGRSGQTGEEEWQMAQRERKARRKKDVDTKASKGRKMRYEVHAKLQNFMVPVPVVGGDWHDEQIDGLFASLLQS